MSLRLYNTLTRQVAPFEPLAAPRVTLYTCGPTVWNYAHIGNFRTFLFEDLLRRWLEASGYTVYHVMNLTDVDDRIIREAGAAGTDIRSFCAPFVAAFFADRDYLRILPAHDYPRATEFVDAMVRLVEGLLANGTAYRGEDGSVYFSIARFPAYGRLSQLDRRTLKAGASERVQSDEYDKEDARDFVLWKAAKPEDEAVGAAWDAPFGRGRPGWHLECSAMALELLQEQTGMDVLDIHAGGVDLIFPHHEDEIAQACAYTGKEDFARIWMHGEFLNVRGEKMSKRFGNFVTPRALQADGIDPGAIRLLLSQTHYRQKLDLTDEGLAAAREGSRRLGELDRRLRAAGAAGDDPGLRDAAERLDRDAAAALDDDLDAPGAVRALFDFVREANRLLDAGAAPGAEVLARWRRVTDVLMVLPAGAEDSERIAVSAGAADGQAWPETPPEEPERVEAWATWWAGRRLEAKQQRNFAEADRIRGLLQDQGFDVRDRKDGVIELVRR